MGSVKCVIGFYVMFITFVVIDSLKEAKEELDNVIEDEITHKLAEDLLQSIERKFQVDLERSVDMVLVKIKTLLQNGTTHIQDKLVDLQSLLDTIKNQREKEVEACLIERQNETSALAEKALHQMVVCGYALIGHDPAQALTSVMRLKSMIRQGLQPIYKQKKEVYSLLKVCGHDHESLKKVIKCVISKSPLIKSSMMEITGKLIEGVVDLTKLMAHGAMHEACLMEVIKTTEDEAFQLIKIVRNCAYGDNETFPETIDNYIAENNEISQSVDNYIAENNKISQSVDNYIAGNNATVLDVKHKRVKRLANGTKKELKEAGNLIRRMLTDEKFNNFETDFNTKLLKLNQQLDAISDFSKKVVKLNDNAGNNDNINEENNDDGENDNDENNNDDENDNNYEAENDNDENNAEYNNEDNNNDEGEKKDGEISDDKNVDNVNEYY